MSDDLRRAVARKGSFLQTLRAVGWSFFGVRRSADHAQDMARLNPVHVVIAGVACVEQPGECMFVMAQVAVHEVDAQVEEQQGQGHGQPLQGGDIGGGGPGQRDAGDAVALLAQQDRVAHGQSPS